MPHQCTNCSRAFPDGSKEMLSGCPDCGGNKFQFAPTRSGLDRDSSSDSADRSDDAGRDERLDGSSTSGDGAVTRAANTVRNWVTDDSGDSDVTKSEFDSHEFSEWPETAQPPADRAATTGSADTDVLEPGDGSESTTTSPMDAREFEWASGDEDSAQASARSDVVSPEELPSPSEMARDADLGTDSGEEVPDHGRVVSEPTGNRPSLDDLREELNDQFESIKIIQPGQYELNLMELYDREEYIVSLQEDGRYVIDVPDSWTNE